jgi:hypothetical protein
VSANFPKDYEDFLGVDGDTPIPSKRRSLQQAEQMKNWDFTHSGSACPRPGYQYNAINTGGLGLCEYIRDVSGAPTRTLFDVGANLLERKEGSFLISYAGAETTITVQFLVDADTNTWKFQVIEGDDTEVLLEDVGVGIDEASPVTLADLETAIEAISADYTVTITGDDTLPAAFLPQQVNQVLEGTPLELDIAFNYTEAFRKPAGSSDLFAGHQTARNSMSSRNATFINFRECLLIATEEDYPVKCDGISAYRMGMAIGAITSATPTTAGAITANWRYLVRYAHTDAQGNYVPGSISAPVSSAMVAHQQTNLVVPTLQVTSGYATDYAKVNGLQAGVNTITVDAAHTLQIGDTVTLLDTAVSTRFVTQRTVTGRTNTTVTIDGAVVTVADNSIISNGLTIEILRTKNNSAFFYYVAELPNDPSAASITFIDTVVDASVGDEFLLLDREPDPPPKGGIISLHQNVPVITRNPEFPQRLWYADLLFPEGFPEASNYRDLHSEKGGEITGVAPNIAGLEVFFPDSHYRLLGEIEDEVFNWRPVSRALGCIAHDTIRQLENNQIVWLTRIGPRWMGPGGIPQVPGFGVDHLFRKKGRLLNYFKTHHATAVDNPYAKQMLFFLPVESENSGEVYADDRSEVWVLDYKIQNLPRWIGPWTNLNMAGGAACDENGRITFVERRFSIPVSSTTRNMLWFHDGNDDFDQADHHLPIEAEWIPGWEFMGERELKKIFEWIRIWSMDPNRLSGFTLTVKVERDFKAGQYIEFVMSLGQGGGASGWQFEPWGFFPWGMPQATFKESKIPEGGAFALRPVFYHRTVYEKPIVSLLTMSIKSAYQQGLARSQ